MPDAGEFVWLRLSRRAILVEDIELDGGR